jgi:tetratricopeptide (TPR) repeat protein
VRGLNHFHRRTPEDNQIAISYFARAAGQNPESISALYYLGLAHYNNVYYQWQADFASNLECAAVAATKSVEVAPGDPLGQVLTGLLHLFSGRSDLALMSAERAVAADPSFVEARGLLGRVLAVHGDGDAAVSEISLALRLSPRDPWPGDLVSALAMGHFVAGRYAECAWHAERAAHLSPRLLSNHLCIAAARSMLGDERAAALAAAEVRRLSRFSATPLKHILSSSPRELQERFLEGLSRAGLDVG